MLPTKDHTFNCCELIPSRLDIINSLERDIFPYHRQSFIQGAYIAKPPFASQKYFFRDSIIFLSHKKDRYIQTCFTLDNNKELVALFFGEVYGNATAFLEKGHLYKMYADEHIDHGGFLHAYEKIFEEIKKLLIYRQHSESLKDLPIQRRIAIGTMNSIGHNLINDAASIPRLVELCRKDEINFAFSEFETGLFDNFIKNKIVYSDKLKSFQRISQSDKQISQLKLDKQHFFEVRPYGYGFNRNFIEFFFKEENFIVKPKETLWINIRGKGEQRYSDKCLNYYIAIVRYLVALPSVNHVILDGLTKLDNIENKDQYDQVILTQNHMAAKFISIIRETVPRKDISITNHIGAPLKDKIRDAFSIKYFVGTFGSGTWPNIFSDNAIAYILNPKGTMSSLKTDPSYDFTRFEDSTTRLVVGY